MKNTTKKIGLLLMPLLFYFGLTGYGQTITPTVTQPCTPNTGAVTFSITGGTTGYTFYLSRVDYNTYFNYTPQSSPTFTSLPSGSYYIYASNSMDSLSANFTISSLVTATPTITNATCTQSNGSAVGAATGGTGPYSYHWLNSNQATIGTGTSITGEPAGSYYVIVTDQSGCISDTTAVSIAATSPITSTLTSSGSVCAPTLSVTAAGGAVPYSYTWNTGATAVTSINATTTGTYGVVITDANGCTASSNLYVVVSPLSIDSMSTQIQEPTCVGNNGSIDILISQSNGSAPFSFVWANSSVTDSIITGLTSGSYSVTITDGHGCIGTETFYLFPSTIGVSLGINTNPTCGVSDGSITAAGYNGTAPYSYVWSPSGSGATLTGIPAGTYAVTATDANQCTASANITLTSMGNYSVSVNTTPTACDTALHTGTATAIITGSGNAPYNFSWYINYSSVVGGNTQTISNLSYGTEVSVSVTDADGCIPTNYQYLDSGYIALDPSCYDHITGYVFLDANANCIFGTGDAGVAGANVFATSSNGQTYYGVSDSAGYYDIEVLPGTYTVQYNLISYGYCTATSCISSYPASFTAIGQISSGNNFGIGVGSTFDLGVHPGTRPSAPGSQKEYWVYYYNYGSTSANNVTVSFTYDPSLTLSSTTPSYTSLNTATNTVSWNVGTVAPTTGNWFSGYLHMWFDVPSTDSLNQILYAQAEVDPITGDCNPADNIVNISDVVTGSHDPNAKTVSPAGNLSATDTVLTYTILFENDGNAPANTIVIVDTLSPNVNPATFQPGASSFPGYKYSITGKGIVTFTFQGINLPVGPANQGFVSYSVQTKKDLPIGSQVENTGYVYFDENPAVITNTTVNVRSNYPTGISEVKGGSMSAQVVPNPANDKAQIQFTGYTGKIDLRITDEVGNVLFTGTATDNTYTVDAHSLSTGIYFYIAKDANGNKASGKISIVH